jgi:two-component system NarL family response regulator
LSAETWRSLAAKLGLSGQQARIVELILRGACDKQIAAELGLRVPTVRTYLDRIFQRTGTNDRLHLVLRIFALAQGISADAACHQQR